MSACPVTRYQFWIWGPVFLRAGLCVQPFAANLSVACNHCTIDYDKGRKSKHGSEGSVQQLALYTAPPFPAWTLCLPILRRNATGRLTRNLTPAQSWSYKDQRERQRRGVSWFCHKKWIEPLHVYIFRIEDLCCPTTPFVPPRKYR
ncbi:hypothetical protein COOONC_08569 [Cooperia oncophora]